jgi:N-acyl-D-aspartate/D-glutamate deacylase
MKQKITRRKFIKDAAFFTAGFAVASTSGIEASPSFDLILKNGNVLDGTGSPSFVADIGIKRDEIAAIGTLSPDQGKKVIDASSLHVSPGFIDIHSHSDGSILGYPTSESRVLQGITTELTGNCGSSAAPMTGTNVEDRKKTWLKEEDIRVDWSDVSSYFARLEKEKISINQALLLGQGTLRESLIGNVDRPLKQDELKNILRWVEEGMDQGAYGISTGLEYTPGRYTPTQEIIEMARIVSRRGGLYASHIRNEEATLLEAINEAINIGQSTGGRVEVSHLKAAGVVNWGKQEAAINLIESARKNGIDVLADAYPYTAYSTGLTVYLYSWALEGTSADLVKRLQNPEMRARMRKELVEHIPTEPGSFDLIVISAIQSDKNRSLVGKNLAELGELWKMESVDAMLRLLEEEQGNVSIVGHGMSPENVRMVLSHPLVMIGSDGLTMAPRGKLGQTRPHPRSYGTCPRVLGYYSREQKLFDLPTAVKKMTSLPAAQIGLANRGRIAKSMKADLVVFNAASVKDLATFEEPHRYPQGIDYVIVNGVMTVDHGKHTGARSGSVLRG